MAEINYFVLKGYTVFSFDNIGCGESEGETRPNSSSELKESEMKKSRKDEKEVEQKEKSIVKPNVSDLNEKKSRFHFFRKKNIDIRKYYMMMLNT